MSTAKPISQTVYRILGAGSSTARIGIGIIDKSGIAEDFTDFLSPTYALVWILQGQGTYQDQDGTLWKLTPGSAFHRVPDRRHTTRIDPASGWREIFLDLDPGLWQALRALRMIPDDPPVWDLGLDRARQERWRTVLRDLAGATDHDLPALCVRLQGLAMEALAVAHAPVLDDPVERLCHLLATEADGRIDVRQICRRAGLDYHTIRRRFRQRLGLSPHQYRIRRRLERACALLVAGSASLADIAAELGYRSPFEFSAQFRRWMGRSPTAYRSGHT